MKKKRNFLYLGLKNWIRKKQIGKLPMSNINECFNIGYCYFPDKIHIIIGYWEFFHFCFFSL